MWGENTPGGENSMSKDLGMSENIAGSTDYTKFNKAGNLFGRKERG